MSPRGEAGPKGKMWGGRFRRGLDPEFASYQSSLESDMPLAMADLEVNRHWSRALAAAGILDEAERASIEKALDDLADRWAASEIPFESESEDIHSLVERELVRRCGDAGRKIHTGRSRNDQVATDLRIFLREPISTICEALHRVIRALLDKAERHAADPMPGYTHLQRAQPITIGHHALAYVEALARDQERFLQAYERMDRCPLGSGALAGTTVRVDRESLAGALGFTGGPTRNSLDATAARDHVCDLAYCCAMTMANLSRLCEDYVFFASHEAGFLRFGDRVSTGSSLMPQKRNPDAVELVRGAAGQVFGSLTALLTLVKGLPMGYDRDLQRDRESLIPALFQTVSALGVAALAIENAEFDVQRCAKEASIGYQNATDLADLLVEAGVPFRTAHERVGAAVNRAVELGVELQDLPDEDRASLLPEIRGDLRELLSVPAMLNRRNAIGGTAVARVRQEIARWRKEIEDWSRARDQDFGEPEA
ncbi:MAG: argininosuccinate lyase [Planctomycetota bacterium]